MAGRFNAGFDGGSRGNPGPAAWGVVIVDDAGRAVEGHAGGIGRATNNVAEYRALLEALELATRSGAHDVRLFADSELVVKQVKGEYKVRHPDLVPLHAEAMRRVAAFPRFSIIHVPREKNREADRLVNRALNLGESAADGVPVRVREAFDSPAPAE